MSDEIETVRELILKNKKPSYTTTNKKEVRVRCPYCGDSKKNPSSAHMYIEMRPPFRFHCFKCETSGVLNQQTLRDLGIYENDLNVSVINANKDYKQNQGVQKVSYRKMQTLKNRPTGTIQAINSVNYFNNRYGTNYDESYIVEKFKCVTDAVQFFADNNIYVPAGQYQFDKAIGFISSDNSHVIFRDITNTQPRRYYNLALYSKDNLDTISKTYNISNEIDMLEPKVNLVITEGIFDIIGVYNHFYKDTPNEKNTIFAAACGKGYNAVIINYIRMGFLNMNISIYSDADVDVSFYRELKNNSPYLKSQQITVYYNSLYDKNTGYGKDYGVRVEDIKLKKIII
jgi:hypothetical protein